MIDENDVSCVMAILQPYHHAIVYLRIHWFVTTLVDLLTVDGCGRRNQL